MASGTPTAQVRIPVADLIFPPTHLCSHYTTWGKFIRRRRKNYPVAEYSSRRARVGQKFSKKSHGAETCRTVPKIPHSIS